MRLTVLYHKAYDFKLLKFKLFNLFVSQRGNKIIAMNTHLKKDVGLCPEESDDRHYSRLL
jgi:hypothetical protein